MKLSVFLTIAAVLAFLFGLAFFLIPMQTVSLYGITLDPAAQFVPRYLGATFLGVAVLNWLARSAASSEALRAILLGDFVLSALGLIVALWEKIAGEGNALVWSTVVIYLFLTLGFGYFKFMKKAGS